MMYVANSKVEIQLVLIGKYTFSTQFGMSTIYKMQDEDENILVWKTSSSGLCMEIQMEKGNYVPDYARINDLVTIKATVKGFGEYKGEKQVELTRVKVISISHAITKEQIMEEKKQDQMASLEEGDQVITMSYKQYKSHYADCEIVAGSFKRYDDGYSEVKVIVRKGRMKNSGVRGEHFAGYKFKNEEGKCVTYRAVCASNAEKRANKEFPNHKWELEEVYWYDRTHKIW